MLSIDEKLEEKFKDLPQSKATIKHFRETGLKNQDILENLIRYQGQYFAAAKGRRKFGRKEAFRIKYIVAANDYRRGSRVFRSLIA